jgi:hypothetical protein
MDIDLTAVFISMGSLCSKTDTVPSVPTPEKTQSPQPTSIPHGTTSTPSPKHGTSMSARERAKYHAALPQRRHDNGRDYPPPSSESDVFTSQHPARPEMPSRQYPSGGTDRMQRNRSVSMMDATASQSAPSSRRNRAASTATGQMTAGRQGGRSRFPFALQSLLPNDFRYAVGRCPISP